MMLLRAFALSVAPIGLAVALPAPALAQGQSGIPAVQAHLRALNTMTASFAQTDHRGRPSSGTMTLKRPGKIRFDYRGQNMLIVSDGRRLNFLDYDANQQQSWPIADSPLSVLLDPSRDWSRFARVVSETNNIIQIEARDPRRREFGRITFVFIKTPNAPGGLMLQGWNVLDAQNNRTQFRLSGQRFNTSIADSVFRFQPVRGRGPRR